MEIYVIGKLLDEEDNKAVAYKLYDADEKKTLIVLREDIRRAMGRGVQIHGFSLNSSGYINANVANINNLNQLDGKGHLLPGQEKTYILLGIKGFLDSREFKVVDSEENIYVFKLSEIRDKKIVGIYYIDGKLRINNGFGKQIY